MLWSTNNSKCVFNVKIATIINFFIFRWMFMFFKNKFFWIIMTNVKFLCVVILRRPSMLRAFAVLSISLIFDSLLSTVNSYLFSSICWTKLEVSVCEFVCCSQFHSYMIVLLSFSLSRVIHLSYYSNLFY